MAYQKHFAPEPPIQKAVTDPKLTRNAGLATPKEKKLKIILPDGSRNEMVVEDTTIEDVLKRLGINPVEVIVAKNGKIVSEEETAGLKDELKIVRVVHGG
jgi:sulfur carrier protein